eukprot:10236893-Alexandrium_andersonii.AAC.1
MGEAGVRHSIHISCSFGAPVNVPLRGAREEAGLLAGPTWSLCRDGVTSQAEVLLSCELDG